MHQQEAWHDLVTKNLGLAYYAANWIHKREPQTMPLEDIQQEAIIGLIRAAKRFDPDRGFKFSTYATVCIRTGLRDAMRPYRMYRNAVDQQEELNPPNRDETIGPVEKDLVNSLLRRLPPRQREIVERYYLKEQTMKYIANFYGIRRQRVHQIIQAALLIMHREAERKSHRHTISKE